MSSTEAAQAARQPPPALFAVAVFLSAALVFIVQPMVARMLLPRLGGSTAVWNTSLAFFQAALLAGYAYAHLLQRLHSMRAQMAVHIAVLAAAALRLPLQVAKVFGPPAVETPILWLLGVLAVSIGAPFAALSATAPLIQAWYGRIHGDAGRDPYVLYAASNLGSLLALLAYPAAVEPFLRLGAQAVSWSVGYAAFALTVIGLVALAWRRPAALTAAAGRGDSEPVVWRRRAAWLLLSAAPASLLLGVTQHITTDIASAPFLWVIPLALYLLSFIIAFQARPLVPASLALLLHSGFAPIALLLVGAPTMLLLLQLPAHLIAVFLASLVCIQRLAALRPHHGQLTDFYMWLALGGVLGGAVNAFLAPSLLPGVWEYPVVMVLTGLARPRTAGPFSYFRWGSLVASFLCAATVLAVPDMPSETRLAFMFAPAIAGVLVRDHPLAFTSALALLAAASYLPSLIRGEVESHRSFFGVVQIAETDTRQLGRVRVMVHGSTLHGAQSLDPRHRCWPATYYAPPTPIGQAIAVEQDRRASMDIGVVGLGTGATAAYVRGSDRLRFFEIDPMVAKLSFGDGRFTYVRDCARGAVSLTLGDARLSLEKTPNAAFDLLLVDAFSSDAVPTHLMTTEAMRTYLRVLKPDGVLILHLSNRNLELSGPAAAALRRAGAAMLEQETYSDRTSVYVISSSQAMIAARTRAALEPYLAIPLWQVPGQPGQAWTDDYTNVPAAMLARWRQQHQY